MSNLSEQEIASLEACQSAEEWETLCDAVKAAHGNQYPDDWWPEMRLSGRMERIMARFGATPEIKVFAINPDGSRRQLKP